MILIWFTADSHFGHRRIIEYCERPFGNVEEMDDELIRRWNACVKPNDTVWHLGDFCFGDRSAQSYFSRLNGRKHLIWGNHDTDHVKQLPWESSSAYREIRLDREFICLFHYGQRRWNRGHHGAFQLFGHSHGGLEPIPRSLDVGVDAWDYRPIRLSEIKLRLDSLGLLEKFVEHH